MLTVLIAGAGKSSAHLIDYMLSNAKQKWRVVVMDSNPEMIAEKLNGNPKGEAAVIDITDDHARQQLVKNADIVLSLMPPHLHYLLAKDCLKFKKNLITSSYVSDEIRALDEEAKKAGISMMCEMGLDPGIRTGVKVAVVDATGRVLDTAAVFPHEPRRDWDGSLHALGKLVATHGVSLIAIGNGTASRETDQLAADLIKRIHAAAPEHKIERVVVSEAGASV